MVLVATLAVAAAFLLWPTSPPPRTIGAVHIGLLPALTMADLRPHLEAFERIARENEGNRAHGTVAHSKSVEYVAEKLAAANALGEKMSGRTVHITQKAGVDGRLFGSVTNADIADALTRIDFKVAKAQVRMPNGPLKTVGEHTVTVAPHTDVVVEVKVVVLGETD